MYSLSRKFIYSYDDKDGLYGLMSESVILEDVILYENLSLEELITVLNLEDDTNNVVISNLANLTVLGNGVSRIIYTEYYASTNTKHPDQRIEKVYYVTKH